MPCTASMGKRPKTTSVAPGRAHVQSLLREAVERRASDIHLEPGPDGHRARLRVDETLVDALGGATLPAGVVQELAERSGLLRAPLDKPRLGAFEAEVA